MQKAIIIGLAVVILAAGGIYLATSSSDENTDSSAPAQTTPTNQTNENQNTEAATDEQAETATIVYDGSGFSPETLTVSAGTTVTVTNNSSQTMQFDSDPHPAHTDNPELNVETIEAGASNTFTANTPGTFGYHNHLDPSQTGTIIVE